MSIQIAFNISSQLEQKLCDIAVTNGYSKNEILEMLITDSCIDIGINPEMTKPQEFARALRLRWGLSFTIDSYAKLHGMANSQIYYLLKCDKEPRINALSYPIWHEMQDLMLEYCPQD